MVWRGVCVVQTRLVSVTPLGIWTKVTASNILLNVSLICNEIGKLGSVTVSTRLTIGIGSVVVIRYHLRPDSLQKDMSEDARARAPRHLTAKGTQTQNC